jgi:hypothetical protein
MSTINRLSSVDALQPGDLIPVWDSSNGDTRKASLTTLLAFIEANDPASTTRITAPNVDGFNVDVGNTDANTWLIINPVLGYLSGSVSLPSSTYAIADQEITVVFTSSVSTFAVTSTGATVVGTPVQISAYDSFRVRYNATQSTWYTLDTTGGSGGASAITRQDFTGDGTTTDFSLATPPDALGESLQVFINGVYQERAVYTVTGAVITFSEAPPNTSNIEILGWTVSAIGATTSNLVSYSPAGVGAVAETVENKLKEAVSVKDFGAVGDGITDDTAAIQAAFDDPSLAPIYFPFGTYKVSGTGLACLTLSVNKNIYGCNLGSTIRADNAGGTTALILVAITASAGFGDVRGWEMRNIKAFHNGGGQHGLFISGGLSMSASLIEMCSFGAGTAATGYGLYVNDQLSHSKISVCQFDYVYMKCLDANVIDKCLTFGSRPAITFDCDVGVRNNTVSNCTLVNRDGQVRIINGDNIRIINNQMELAQGYTPPENQSAASAMVWIEGSASRDVINTVIRDNNFGGGTNLDHLIYTQYADRTVIDANQLIAVNDYEIYLSPQTTNTVICGTNKTIGSISNPRPRTLFKANIFNGGGLNNMGCLSPITGANSWTTPDVYKDEYGRVHFIGEFNAGTPAAGTLIGTLPPGFLPLQNTLPASTSLGMGTVNLNTVNGQITVNATTPLPSNSSVCLPSYQSNNET